MLTGQAQDWTQRRAKHGLFLFFFLGIHMVIEEPPEKVTEQLLEAPVVRAFPREAYAEDKMKKMQQLL